MLSLSWVPDDPLLCTDKKSCIWHLHLPFITSNQNHTICTNTQGCSSFLHRKVTLKKIHYYLWFLLFLIWFNIKHCTLASPSASSPTPAVILFIDFLETDHCNLRLRIRSLLSTRETAITLIWIYSWNIKYTTVADDGPKFCPWCIPAASIACTDSAMNLIYWNKKTFL